MSEAQDWMECALAIAREAAAVAAAGWRTRLSVKHKSPKDLVTEYDLRCEELIRERLARRCPELPIVGEEGGGSAGAGPAWYCDPIDGTTNYAHGHAYWCVSLGVMRGEEPLAGAVVAPALSTEWTGFAGGPARRNGELVQVSAVDDLDLALVATGFPPVRDFEPDNNFGSFARVKQRVGAVRRCGAAAIDLCSVADGTYEAYWERRVHAWDLAAAAAVAAAAGARITYLDGGPPRLTQGHVLASNGLIHDTLIQLIDYGNNPAPDSLRPRRLQEG